MPKLRPPGRRARPLPLFAAALLTTGVVFAPVRPVRAQAAEPAAAAEEEQMLVLIFRIEHKGGVAREEAEQVAGIVATESARIVRGMVETLDDARRRVSAGEEANNTRQCDEFSCLQELGNAMGVPFYVQGDLGKVGQKTWTLNLQVADMRDMRVKKRHTLRIAGTLDDLIAQLDSIKLRPLYERVTGLPLREAEAPPPPVVADAPAGGAPTPEAPAAPRNFGTRVTAAGNRVFNDAPRNIQWHVPANPPSMAWDKAGDYCKKLNVAGKRDWRLPTIHELRSLIVGCDATNKCGDPSTSLMQCERCDAGKGPARGCYVDATFGLACDTYWSASFHSAGPWNVVFTEGYVNNGNVQRTADARVICLRGGTIDGPADFIQPVTPPGAAPPTAAGGGATGGAVTGAFSAVSGGAVQDSRTGWVWTAGPPPRLNFAAARDYCENLSAEGRSDWHLPSIHELRTLIEGCDAGKGCGNRNATIQECTECSVGGGPFGGCYSNTGALQGGCTWAWSSSQDAGQQPWYIDFNKGYIGQGNMNAGEAGAARCVAGTAGGAAPLPAGGGASGGGGFSAVTGNTVRDGRTGFVWVSAPPQRMTFDAGRSYCDNLSAEGRSDWRMPTIHELRTLIEGCDAGKGCGNRNATIQECTECSAGGGPFGGCYSNTGVLKGGCGWVWSSSRDDGREPWYIDFTKGYIGQGNMKAGDKGAVRCVAGP